MYKGIAIAVFAFMTFSTRMDAQLNDFRLLREEYTPGFSTNADDFTMGFPSFMVFSLKVLGLKSESDWKPLITNHLIATGVMAAITSGLKYAVPSTRPDKSDRKSFPSGHSALSFMGAHIVYKEFGSRYPWSGACAYGVAVATGAMRIMNDKHHIQDVVAGAGIGILSAEVGYLLGSLIFNKGMDKSWISYDTNNNNNNPLLQLSLITGFNNTAGKIRLNGYTDIRVSRGVTSGGEFAINFTERYGAVISCYLNSAPAVIERERFSIKAPVLTWQTLIVTPEFSFNLHRGGWFGIRAGGGYTNLSQRESFNYSIGPHNGFSVLGGVNYRYQANNIIQYKLFTNIQETFLSKFRFTNLTYGLGLSFTVKNR
ncbi:MAG: phosphatase PAP2 family protein [Bacteroidales bacterium]|nr:phosphatase PAP2 family protein [Bacteroidales bacterium]MDD2424923.1 phosphatase PAP2 family protein [Bacteroidales bacterium]MDD3989075.1 phosphatase PAP2 family protein [Bacteroidales bacterium]MDD4638758.1 phosphatase PAP2 family protein [Bacteroidales bacterium]